MQTLKTAISLSLALSALAMPADGAALKYSTSQLDEFWKSQVTAPTPAAFNDLVTKKTEIQGTETAVEEEELPPDELMTTPSHKTEIKATLETSAGKGLTVVVFPVISYSANTATLMKRSAVLNSYLSKERFWTKQGSETDIAKIDQRRNAAQMELFLISLVRFGQARTLPLRCQQAIEAQTWANHLETRTLLSDSLPVPEDYAGLVEKYTGAKQNYNLENLNRRSCSARTVTSKAELLRLMKERASQRLLSSEAGVTQLLTGYDVRTKALLTKQLENHTAVEAAVNEIDMKVSKLIILRDKLFNIRSSYSLVRDDRYYLRTAPQGIKSSIQDLQGIDYVQLKKDFSVSASTVVANSTTGKPLYQQRLEAGEEQYQAVIGEAQGIKSILKSYNDLYTQSPNDLKVNLLVCSSLADDFSKIEKMTQEGTSTSATQLKTFRDNFGSCLTQATDYYIAQQKMNESQFKIDDTFAQLVSLLSNTLLKLQKAASGSNP